MSETALLYALSTLAQTCAALVAFVGALGLYRLQSLSNRRADAERDLRGVVCMEEQRADWGQAIPTVEIIHRARDFLKGVHPGRDPGWVAAVASQYEDGLRRWEMVGPDQRRTSRLLLLFVGWNLLTILMSIVGFNFVAILKDSWFSSLGLWIAAVGATLVTGFMLLEMLGSFPDWLRRLRLNGLLTWLERPYRTQRGVV